MNWLRDEFERAKRRNALLPKYARPVYCGPAMTTRRTPRLALSQDFIDRMTPATPLCDREVDAMGVE